MSFSITLWLMEGERFDSSGDRFPSVEASSAVIRGWIVLCIFTFFIIWFFVKKGWLPYLLPSKSPCWWTPVLAMELIIILLQFRVISLQLCHLRFYFLQFYSEICDLCGGRQPAMFLVYVLTTSSLLLSLHCCPDFDLFREQYLQHGLLLSMSACYFSEVKVLIGLQNLPESHFL